MKKPIATRPRFTAVLATVSEKNRRALFEGEQIQRWAHHDRHPDDRPRAHPHGREQGRGRVRSVQGPVVPVGARATDTLITTNLELTAIVSSASMKCHDRLAEAEDDAASWLEALRSGALSDATECVTCGRGKPLEDNHVAGRRHGTLTVPMCPPCHQRITEGQDLWDPHWQDPERSPELDKSLLVRGLIDLLRLKAQFVPESEGGAYSSLASSLREQYARIARTTL
jgi:hypothetical protein